MTERQEFRIGREVKTPQGIRIGDAEYSGGYIRLVVKRGKKTDVMFPKDLIEQIYGKKVERIIFQE